jgi:hypothetical protein
MCSSLLQVILPTMLRSSLLTRRFLSAGKDIRFGVDGRNRMLAGVDILADAVQVS